MGSTIPPYDQIDAKASPVCLQGRLAEQVVFHRSPQREDKKNGFLLINKECLIFLC